MKQLGTDNSFIRNSSYVTKDLFYYIRDPTGGLGATAEYSVSGHDPFCPK